jgi:hypothetical protein
MAQHLLLEFIHARFRAHFGEPDSILGRDSQWSLPIGRSADGVDGMKDGLRLAPAIFVLVNGSHEKPAAWIFDPYDHQHNVWRCSIASEEHVEESIREIERRLAMAKAVLGDGHGKARV